MDAGKQEAATAVASSKQHRSKATFAGGAMDSEFNVQLRRSPIDEIDDQQGDTLGPNTASAATTNFNTQQQIDMELEVKKSNY